MASMALCVKDDRQHREPAQTVARALQPLILVVEDDASIRRFLCTLLKRTTCALVMDAAAPDLAWSMARSIGQPIDLLISDIDLGTSMNGVELARALSASELAIHVLLMSAGKYPENGIPSNWRFLEKPFPVAELLDCVNALCGIASQASMGYIHSVYNA